jgi:hypothetical protein
LDFLNRSDKCLISDSSDSDTDDCEDDITVADSTVEENSEMEEEGQGHSLGDADHNSGFIWEDMGKVNYFLVNLDIKTLQ